MKTEPENCMPKRKQIRRIVRRAQVTRSLEVATVVSILTVTSPRAKGRVMAESIAATGRAPVPAQVQDFVVPEESCLTVALSSVEPMVPGGLLPVDIEIVQPGSTGLSSLSLILQYDPRLLQISAPIEEAFDQAPGGPEMCNFEYQVNPDAGLVALTLSGQAQALLAGKSSRLAKIVFALKESVEPGEPVHLNFINVLATDEAGWAIPARGVDLELAEFKGGI